MTKKERDLIKCFCDGAESLVFFSFRYFLGRRTIATCTFADNLARAYPLLEERWQNLIMKELEEAFEQDKRNEALGHNVKWLGDECDRDAWEKVLDVCHDCTRKKESP